MTGFFVLLVYHYIYNQSYAEQAYRLIMRAHSGYRSLPANAFIYTD